MSYDAQNRRDFLRTAALGLTAARAGAVESLTHAAAALRAHSAPKPFGPVKQIDAELLNVGYVEMGPAAGRAVLLLHGCRTTSIATPT